MKLSKGFLYFSNTNLQIVARIKACGIERRLKGNPEIVTSQTPVDDFVVNDLTRDIYIAEQAPVNGLGFVARDAYSSVLKTIVGGSNSTSLLGPTTAIWAKDAKGRTLIVSVIGGFEQFVTKDYTSRARLAVVDLEYDPRG